MGSHDPGTAAPTPHYRTAGRVWLIVALAAFAFGAKSPEEHHAHHAMADGRGAVPGLPALVSSAQPFDALMGEAMASMDSAMRGAPMTGDPDHDFAAMMIPHHQGAIEMAQAELLYGRDPVLRRLAQEIIVTQTSEITVMQRQLGQQHTSETLQH